ncbi:unnamed protein product, partial [Vitis vinifera]
METWVYNIVISLCVAALLKSLYDFIFPKLNLPPGPTTVPFVGNLLWLLKSFSELEPILRNLHAKYGPIVTLQIGSRPAIFVSANSLAHRTLSGEALEEKQIQEIETIQRILLLGFPRFNILNFWPRVGKQQDGLESDSKLNDGEMLLEEISGVMGEGKEEVEEEDLQKMPYLKAVILEGLRRHPPGHFVLPHSVTQDITFEGYVIPKNASLNFMVSEMNWNPKIWEDPMEFKPERFLNSKGNGDEVFDITGSREIKMMPFGAGRRICPGHGLAMLHLESTCLHDGNKAKVDGFRRPPLHQSPSLVTIIINNMPVTTALNVRMSSLIMFGSEAYNIVYVKSLPVMSVKLVRTYTDTEMCGRGT